MKCRELYSRAVRIIISSKDELSILTFLKKKPRTKNFNEQFNSLFNVQCLQFLFLFCFERISLARLELTMLTR